jgi:putative transposase
MARPVRIEYPGAVYHIISRGNNRQFIFRDDQDRKKYLERLAWYCQEKEVHLLAYCLLTNHVHLLLQTPKGNLSKMMQPFQTSYTTYFNKRHRRSGHVFEQRYKAFVVDKDNYLLQVSRYIHLNPVQAKLVQRPRDYSWSSYRAYVREKTSSWLHREVILEQLGGKAKERLLTYRHYVEGAINSGKAWEPLPVIGQAFVGDEGFARQAKRKSVTANASKEKYNLREIVQAVGQGLRLEENDLRKSLRKEEIQKGREILMYLARRHGEISLKELVDFLSVKEMSTVSHGVKRAEVRLKEDRDFRQSVDRILKKLAYSSMQA